MKVTAAILLGLCLHASATGISQTITFSGKDVSLQEVIVIIKKQTGLGFVYSTKEIKKANPVTIDVHGVPYYEFLSQVFLNQPLTFDVDGNTVFIRDKKKENKKPDLFNELIPPITVKGKVVNEKGEPIAASVIVKGTRNGTTTDSYGFFSITNVDNNAVLIISGINIETQEIKVAGRTEFIIVTNTKVSEEQEIIFNGGYYKTTEKLRTGSIVKVTSKDIGNQPVTSPLLALQGRVPGVEITPANGGPGIAPKIRIRGLNSLRQSGVGSSSPQDDGNYPLYIIDGIPVSAVPFNSFSTSFTSSGYDPLSTINPSSIESIEILKDGDATAIYGSRGANGVILITTKKKVKDDAPTSFEITGYTGVGKVSRRIDLLNLEQYLSMRNEALSNGSQTPGEVQYDHDLIRWDTTRSTDWQQLLIGGTYNITDIQAGISSGTKNTSFRFNGGYHKETLIYPGDFGYSRITGQLTINHVSSNQKFRMTLSTIYGLDNGNYFAGDGEVMQSALTLAPNAPKIYNDDGTLNWELHDFAGNKNTNTWENPYKNFKKTQNSNTRNNISSLSLSYELLPGLFPSVTAGYTDVANHEQFKIPRSASSPSESPTGAASFLDSKRTSWIVEPKVSYNKKFNEHKIDLVGGITLQKNTASYYNAYGTGYVSDALLNSLKSAPIIILNFDWHTQYKFSSTYARFGYNYQDKYIINLTGRRDGSSRFGPGNRFGNFGSVGAAWVISNESFLKNAMPIMNFAKLRGSYGLTGSDNIGEYNYYSLYTVLGITYGGRTGSIPFALFNENYAWEVTKKAEAALEMAFAENRVGLEINWYRNRSSNQLVNYPLSQVTGFQSVLKNFNATIENTGWEALVRVEVLNLNSLRWNTSLNITLPKNKLVQFDGIEDSPYKTIYKVGEPLTTRYLYTWTGVNRETGQNEFVDQNNNGKIEDQDRSLMNLAGRVFYGGITNTIQYKSVELSFNLQYSHRQGQMYLPRFPGAMGANQPVSVLGRWQKSGDETTIQKFSNSAYDDASLLYTYLQLSNYNTTDASFIRLKTLSLNWQVPAFWVKKAKLREIAIFVQGQNLLTFTKYPGLDPETGSALPPLRMITMGVQIKL